MQEPIGPLKVMTKLIQIGNSKVAGSQGSAPRVYQPGIPSCLFHEES